MTVEVRESADVVCSGGKEKKRTLKQTLLVREVGPHLLSVYIVLGVENVAAKRQGSAREAEKGGKRGKKTTH